MKEDLTQYIDNFSQQRIMVIGDIIADEFIVGRPERLSREAPVLILRRHNRQIKPGGAANAAYNICSLEGKVRLVGIVGKDSPAHLLREKLKAGGINIESILVEKNRPTSLKTRILAGGDQVVKQQVVRIDHLDRKKINTSQEDRLLKEVMNNIDSIDGMILSDYGNGLFTPRIKQSLIKIAKKNDKFVAVDSRYDLLNFKGATVATPNLEEAGRAVGRELASHREVIEAGQEILELMDLKYLLLTRGSDGMTLFSSGGETVHIPVANFSEVYDVTGAGDTVIGTFCLALASGAKAVDAMNMANFAAGIVVRKSGVAAVKPEELYKEVKDDE
ncbi:MAG: bifunctional heptose 7-phosphate kinase/heptose 1-phosphate adenyltransferase [Halanaerobiales bacterium]